MADKIRFELRLDADVHDAMKGLAERANISLNQLIGGIARWAAQRAHVGRPVMQDRDEVITLEGSGIVWFGDDGDSEGEAGERARIDFVLDFTERNAVRDGAEYGGNRG